MSPAGVDGRNGGATLLAIDTSGPIGSVAVARDGVVVARAVLAERSRHASALVPALDEVLGAAGVDRRGIGGFVVGEGPGSFTGVRVAAATAKGLAAALHRPLWAVSSLAAAAMTCRAAPIRYALFDARAERVYGACYGVGSRKVETLVAPHADELRSLLDGDVPPGALFCGDGAEKHRGVIEGAGFAVAVADGSADSPESTSIESMTLADGLVDYWARCPDLAPVDDVGAWEPEYVRASGAERLWGG